MYTNIPLQLQQQDFAPFPFAEPFALFVAGTVYFFEEAMVRAY